MGVHIADERTHGALPKMETRRAHLNSFKLTSLTLSIIVPEKFELENSRLAATGVFNMKAFVLQAPGRACIETVPDPVARPGDLLLQVRMVGRSEERRV